MPCGRSTKGRQTLFEDKCDRLGNAQGDHRHPGEGQKGFFLALAAPHEPGYEQRPDADC